MRQTLPQDKITQNALQAMKSFHHEAVAEVEKAIVADEWVVVGMAHNPVVKKARKMLDEKGIAYKYIEHGNYFGGWKPRLAIKLWSGWPTFPQIFHKGFLIGGAADLATYKA